MSRHRSLSIAALTLGVTSALLVPSASAAVPAPSPTPVTTVAGQALDSNGVPLAGVTLSISAWTGANWDIVDSQQLTTGADGRFSATLSYAAEYLLEYGPEMWEPNPPSAAQAWDGPFAPGLTVFTAFPGVPATCTFEAIPTSEWTRTSTSWSGQYSSFNCGYQEQWYDSVHRFWSPKFNNAHFFTTDYDEAERIRTSDPNWTYENVAFLTLIAVDDACEVGTPVYRFYSPVFQSHFYTRDAAEKAHVIANDRNWTYEGVAYCAFDTAQPGTVPLYRFWSPRFGKHFYTANEAEKNHIVANDRNWTYENIAYYVVAP